MDAEEVDEEFDIPKDFIDELDEEDNIQLLSSSDSEAGPEEEQDYLSQIEDNSKVQEWWSKQRNSSSPNNKKRKRDESDIVNAEEEDAEDGNNNNNEKDRNAKYHELIAMEQSTSGLDLSHIRESQLFREFRVIGLVCNDVRFSYQKLGDSFFIGTSIGKSFQVYEGKTLRLKVAGRSSEHKINAILMHDELTFTAVGHNVEVWYRMKRVSTIRKHVGTVYIIKLLGHLLVTVAEDGMMYTWDIKRLLNRRFDITKVLNACDHTILREPVKSINFQASHNEFVTDNERIECIAHPPTYLNKIVVGYSSGKMQVWNINTCRCIYTFKNHFDSSSKADVHNRLSCITCIRPSPILDVVGVGYSNGMIVIHNIRTDEQVMKFEHFNQKVNDLAFRLDGTPQLVSVGSDGNIVIWNLKKRKLDNIHYNAHEDQIISARFIEDENVLITSSMDNSLKMWLLEEPQIRLLKMRGGHSSEPYLCKFHGTKCLLSTSNDNTLRVSWIQRDIQCLAMGQRSLKKQPHKKDEYKVPRIKQMCSSKQKSRFWSNLVTVHNDDNIVRLWSTSKFKLNEQHLSPKYLNKESMANVSCAVISNCGNSAYVGRVSGVIDKYNMQSATHRMQISNAHCKPIRSLHLSLFNNVLISCSADGLIKFWNVGIKNNNSDNVKCQYVIEEIANNNEIISHSCYDQKSNLLAVGTDNLFVYLFDGSNGKLIRKFKLMNHAQITDMTFSPRCKWLLISTMDGCVAVFDLMSGLIIDWFKFDAAVTCMAFNGIFLATTHINTMGIHIWANKHHFGEAFLKPVGSKPVLMDRKNATATHEEQQQEAIKKKIAKAMDKAIVMEEDDDEEDSSEDEDVADILDLDYQSDDDEHDEDVYNQNEQDLPLPDISSLHLNPDNEFVTMSANPKSIWKNLANWDIILQRNRPSMKVKKNVRNIPFFIPTRLHHQHIEMDTSQFAKEYEEKQAAMENERKMAEFEKKKKILKHVGDKFKIDHKLCDKYNTASRLVYFIKKELEEKENDETQVEYEVARDYLLSLVPSAADAELHSIGLTLGTSKTELILIFKFFIYQLQTNRNYEHIQAYIALFLKIHTSLIIKHANTLNAYVVKLHQVAEQRWSTINDLFQSNLCLIQFYSHLQQ